MDATNANRGNEARKEIDRGMRRCKDVQEAKQRQFKKDILKPPSKIKVILRTALLH